MFRNSITYRRLWYVKRRNAQSIHIFLRLIFIFILLAFLVFYTEKKIIPGLLEVYEARVKTAVSETVINIAGNYLEKGLDYNELVSISKDNSGRIVSLEGNISKMNSISGQVAAQVSEQMAVGNTKNISMPCGALLDNNILYNIGPVLHIHMVPVNNAEAAFKSEFSDSCANQTIHKIYLQVRIKMKISSFLVNEQKEIITDVPVAENIIVGEAAEKHYAGNALN